MDWRFNTIWFEQLEKNKIFQKDFKENNLELYVVGEVIEKNEYNVYVRGRKI